MRNILVLFTLATMMGCVTKPQATYNWNDVGATHPKTGVVKRALCVGLSNSKSAGECPGADVDAKVAVMLANQQGFDTRILENEKATRGTVLAALRAMVSGAEAGSTLFLFWSGHGGQIQDMNGDEIDGKDECLYPWDDYIVDDELGDVFAEVKEGVKVFFICDTCHSETMARRALVSPNFVSARSFKASLLLFAGCSDSKVSYGSSNGGFFTTALLDSWRDGITYEQWFDAACKAMPKWPNQMQVPQMTGYGDTSWINQPALK